MEYDLRLYNSLIKIIEKYNSLTAQLEDPNISISKLTDANKQLKRIGAIKSKFDYFQKLIQNAESDEKIIKTETDAEFIDIAKTELADIKSKIPELENELKIMLLPVDPYDEKNIIVEMRPAAGGDESSIFTADLFETYRIYCERMG
jgi:peptide chain release factor 1